MYAVGSPHPLKVRAREFFLHSRRNGAPLVMSAEVLQELFHVYSRTGRFQTLEDAISLINDAFSEVWPLEKEDVDEARALYAKHPNLQARDLCHLASCRRRGVVTMMTFDRSLLAAADALTG